MRFLYLFILAVMFFSPSAISRNCVSSSQPLLFAWNLFFPSLMEVYPTIHRFLVSYWFIGPMMHISVTLLCFSLLQVLYAKIQDSLNCGLFSLTIFHALFGSPPWAMVQQLSPRRKLRFVSFLPGITVRNFLLSNVWKPFFPTILCPVFKSSMVGT